MGCKWSQLEFVANWIEVRPRLYNQHAFIYAFTPKAECNETGVDGSSIFVVCGLRQV